MGLVGRLRKRFGWSGPRAAGPDEPGSNDGFVHTPDADPEDVPPPKRIGFDGRELPQSGSQSGHFPTGGGLGGA